MKPVWDFTEWLRFSNKLVGSSSLQETYKRIAKQLAKTLLKRIKGLTPVDQYDLITAWDRNKFLVIPTSTGYEVLLTNETEYAVYVNDGHRQKPGRFIPGYWEGTHFRYDPNANGGMVLRQPWVKGRFFVEKGILQLNNTSEIEAIIMQELQRWWGSV